MHGNKNAEEQKIFCDLDVWREPTRHSNTGHILPCCWVDGEVLKRHELSQKIDTS